MKNKLLLVGWDAADWSVLNPLLAQGKMPALASLIDRGFRGNLASLQPMLSPLLWTSIATGVRAHEHGILNFVEEGPDGKPRAVRGSSRKAPTFWEILHDRGIKSNVIGWWPSHPAQDSGGVQVSNFFGKTSDKRMDPLHEGVVFPREKEGDYAELRVHVTEMTAEILAPFFPNAGDLTGSDGVVSSVARIVSQASSIHAATTEAMATVDWDITAVYLDAIDHFKHLAMQYHPPKQGHVSEIDFKRYHGIVEAGYRFHDMMLDRLLTLAGSDCHVLLVSDHGFASGSERVMETPDVPGGPASEHHPYGVLVGAGPSWKAQKVYGHSLLDICPAILQLFGAPISKEMTGRVPTEWWYEPNAVQQIESYSMPESQIVENEDVPADNEILDDLEKLGYIDLPKDELAARRAIEADSRYNRIASLLDAGMWIAAKDESSRLCADFPSDPRFTYQLLGIQLMLQDSDFEKNLHLATSKFPSLSANYFSGMDALNKGYYAKAAEQFEVVLKSAQINPALVVTMAKAQWQAGRVKEAVQLLDSVVEQFPRDYAIPDLLAEIHWEEYQKNSDAKERELALSNTLEAIDRRYYSPKAHERLANICFEMEEWEVAANAYQIFLLMAPFNTEVLHNAAIALERVGKDAEAENMRKRLNINTQIIVTGWPRSGTSMMMNMLHSGGLTAFTDGVREPDSSNAKGYFEHEAIKNSLVDVSWLNQAHNKVAKVVFPLVQNLPGDRKYLFIWMRRPLTEVILSQEVMAGKKREEVAKYFPFGKAMKMEAEEKSILEWAEKSGHIELLEIDFNDCIANPKLSAERIKAKLTELGIEVEVSEMIGVVDAGARHQKM